VTYVKWLWLDFGATLDFMTTKSSPSTSDQAPSAYCPAFQGAVELIGKRWSGAIVRSMLSGSVRFSDILGQIPGLSDRLLSERLRELEAAGVVKRHVYAELPVRIEYTLTEKGRELRDIIISVDRWADRWAPAPAEACSVADASAELSR
jgi:DNA-binding HxlR family transcriptional regulator